MRESNTDLGPLILGFLDDTLSADQLAALESHLESDPAARDLLVHICTHASLVNEKLADSFEGVPGLLRVQGSGFRVQEEKSAIRNPKSAIALALAAAIALALTAWFFLPEPRTPTPEPSATQSVALLTNTAEAVFIDSAAPMNLGAELAPGLIRLESGTAQLMFHRGAVVSLMGPCAFRIVDDNRGHLQRGALEATVPPGAIGFSVDGPRGVRVVDLGTEFRMAVDDRARTEVYVVRGRVRMTLPNQPGGEPASMELAASAAGAFDPATSTRSMHTLDAQTFLRSWWRRIGADQIDAKMIDAALLDTDADGLGDSTFVPARGAVAVGEQNRGADRHPLRYYLPFEFTDEQRAAVASAKRIELAITLEQVQHIDDYTMQLIGLAGHAPIAASPDDYQAPGEMLNAAAMTADTAPGEVRLDVTDFVRAQVQSAEGVVFRFELSGPPLPHVDQKINNFIINTQSHADTSRRPRLELHWSP